MVISSSNQLNCRINSSSATSSSNTLNSNNWHHVVCTYDGNTIRAYIDGVEVATKNENGLLQTTGDIGIGYNVTGGANRHFIGSIDDMYVFNDALNQYQISEIFSGQVASQTPPDVDDEIETEIETETPPSTTVS
jgi:hypothetical protein